MSDCDKFNNTLDPYLSILSTASKGITTLENQALLIKPYVDQFRSLITSITPSVPSNFNDAINTFTADAVCAASLNLSPIDSFVGDCLNEAAKSVKQYLNNILGNIGDAIDLVFEPFHLPEIVAMNLLQIIKTLTSSIKDLISGLDIKLNCASLSEQYSDIVDDLNGRIGAVTDALYLDADGSFNSDNLFKDISGDLLTNMQSFEQRTNDLKQEIEDNVTNTVDLTEMVNPKKYF